MINFTVITDTPQRLANFLVNRGIIEQKTDPQTEETYYVGVRPGMEWVRAPNPIMTDPGSGTPGEPGYIPPTYDDRSVFLVKFAHESETADADGDLVDANGDQINQYDRTKFGKWVMANSTPQTAPVGWTINGQPVGTARKVNGENVWLIRDNPERFGVWQ
jgi:hypothetical protein